MTVAIRKGKNIRKNIQSIFNELNFTPQGKVFIKPNLCGRKPVLPGENTSIETMDALIEVLKNYNCDILIGHGALLGSTDPRVGFEEVLLSSGFSKYKNKEHQNIYLLNLDLIDRQKIKTNEMTFHLPLNFLRDQIDYYINLAKIKTHMETTVSLCLKNQMGLPSPRDRVMMHQTNLEKTIAQLACYCKPDFNLVEGFPAMENNGPHHGTPRRIDLLAGGRDIVELDSFISEILGYNPNRINHIQYAQIECVGDFFNTANILEYRKYFVKDFQRASIAYSYGLRLKAYPTYSCSRCINAVNLAGKAFKRYPLKFHKVLLKSLFSFKKLNVIFGKADELTVESGKYICVGNCAKAFARKHDVDCLDKCPPGIDATREYLYKAIVED